MPKAGNRFAYLQIEKPSNLILIRATSLRSRQPESGEDRVLYTMRNQWQRRGRPTGVEARASAGCSEFNLQLAAFGDGN